LIAPRMCRTVCIAIRPGDKLPCSLPFQFFDLTGDIARQLEMKEAAN
jgi:hypothetical protein